MHEFFISAIVNERLCEKKVKAITEKQAWYKFCQVFGYKHRDYKILGKTSVVV